MALEIIVPQLPESVANATLAVWYKKVGDFVEKNENLLDLETDKVILEVPAPEAGVLTEIIKNKDDIVVAGEALARFDPFAQAAVVQEAISTENPNAGILSPAVRRLVTEKQLDPTAIAGSGKSGRITKTDVEAFLRNQQPQVTVAEQKPASAVMEEKLEAVEVDCVTKTTHLRPEQRVPMTRLRAKVAERLLQAQQNAAMLTTFNEVNMQAVIDLRQQYKARFEQKHSIKLGLMSFFVKAAIEGLKRFPALNASIDDKDIIYHGYYDIGIAVTTERGLIVPVLRDADQLDFAGIEKSIADFGSRGRAGKLTYEDLTGGTFTITNGGIFGSMLSTPILNPPQCAILGMHAIKERPVVENGEIVIRPIMYLALSYDHRLIDGREAVQFLVTIKECLEAPAHLLLNI
jgi:2-oxoglutarate dehydrogenase E2 component (dihydrolipoamide succinyltransferase)